MASDFSLINIPLGLLVSNNVRKALRQIKTVSVGSQDLGLQRASMQIPTKITKFIVFN